MPDHVHERHRGRAEGACCTASATSPASACRPSTGSTRAPGELVWCTAASGWSKSARNVFIAPWLRGAAALLHDARFDPAERLELLDARARRRALHGADRVPRDRQARDAAARCRRCAALVAAGEALNPEVLRAWQRGDRPADPRRLRPDRDRPADRHAARRAGAARLDGPRRCRACGCGSTTASSSPTRRRVPTFFLGYLGERRRATRATPWRTGDRVTRDEDGFLYFEGRTDDVIISAGYRIGPFEVESALVAHPAVAEAAVVAAPDEERGASCARSSCCATATPRRDDAGARAAGPRQGADRALQVPARSSTSPTSCRRRAAARCAALRCCARARGEQAARRCGPRPPGVAGGAGARARPPCAAVPPPARKLCSALAVAGVLAGGLGATASALAQSDRGADADHRRRRRRCSPRPARSPIDFPARARRARRARRCPPATSCVARQVDDHARGRPGARRRVELTCPPAPARPQRRRPRRSRRAWSPQHPAQPGTGYRGRRSVRVVTDFDAPRGRQGADGQRHALRAVPWPRRAAPGRGPRPPPSGGQLGGHLLEDGDVAVDRPLGVA